MCLFCMVYSLFIICTFIIQQVPRSSNSDVAHFNEVKRAIAFILDWMHLFTPACLVFTSLRVSMNYRSDFVVININCFHS